MSNPLLNLLKKAVGLPTEKSSSCCSVPGAAAKAEADKAPAPEQPKQSSCCG